MAVKEGSNIQTLYKSSRLGIKEVESQMTEEELDQERQWVKYFFDVFQLLANSEIQNPGRGGIFMLTYHQCAVPENIHTPPTGISWGVGGFLRPKHLKKCMKLKVLLKQKSTLHFLCI